MNQSATLLSRAAGYFQSRRFVEAKAVLEELTGTGHKSPHAFLMLAVACRELGEDAACEATLDQLLKIEPRTVRALLMKGDLAANAQDERAAGAFYRRGLAVAQAQQNLPPDLQMQLEEVRKWVHDTEEREWQRMEAGLSERGLGPSSRPKRFQESLDILLGRKQVFPQQPTVYYFPGLPHIQFYEPGQFAWAAGFEAQAPLIRAELEALLRKRNLFLPYLVSSGQRPPSGYHGLVDNPDWSSLYLWSDGAPVEENARRCPKTMAALDAVPLARMSVRAPVVMFSLLKGGARIPPHHGSTNTRLICHLPLLVPEKCAFRVGNDTREWQEGRLLIFDDTIEHEAWNDSDEDRVVLIFDIWRPELSAEERFAVQKMFETIDTASFKAGAASAL